MSTMVVSLSKPACRIVHLENSRVYYKEFYEVVELWYGLYDKVFVKYYVNFIERVVKPLPLCND